MERSRGSGKEDVYAQIRRRIVEGDLTPGATLGEARLTAEYGVSRTPVRTALARLEQDGLLERVRYGFAVPARTAQEVIDLFEARIVLELATAELASRRRNAMDLGRLRHLLEQSSGAAASDVAALNGAFHRALHEAAHNQAIIDLIDRVNAQLGPYEARPASAPNDRETTLAEHRQVVDAIEDSDLVGARQALEVHVTRARDIRIAALARNT